MERNIAGGAKSCEGALIASPDAAFSTMRRFPRAKSPRKGKERLQGEQSLRRGPEYTFPGAPLSPRGERSLLIAFRFCWPSLSCSHFPLPGKGKKGRLQGEHQNLRMGPDCLLLRCGFLLPGQNSPLTAVVCLFSLHADTCELRLGRERREDCRESKNLQMGPRLFAPQARLSCPGQRSSPLIFAVFSCFVCSPCVSFRFSPTAPCNGSFDTHTHTNERIPRKRVMGNTKVRAPAKKRGEGGGNKAWP